jgi:hypothetical protein
MDPAEDDRRGLEPGRLAAELERIADEIGGVLDLGELIIMGQDDGVLTPLQLADPGSQVHRSGLSGDRLAAV